MRKFLSYSSIMALLLGGFATTAGAITFGEPDGDDHPYVGTLLFVQNGVGFYSCTGTLIAPTVMVTAGHCTEEAGNVNEITYVRFEEDALADRDAYGSLLEWLDNEWILADAAIPHPQYNDYAEFPNTYDVGVVILPYAVDLGSYGQLPEVGFLDAVKAEPGNSSNWWTAVGYGMQGILMPFYSDEFSRYAATVRLIELVSTFNGEDSSAKFTNHPGGGRGGTCFGDSGGPIFFDDTTIIGAITSWGITPCIGVDYHFRLDTPSALDFLNSYLP
jgi:hypothetical protein